MRGLGWREKLESGEEVTIVTYGDSWTYGSCADGWLEAKAEGYKHELIHGSWALQLRAALKERNPRAQLFNQGQGGWKSNTGLLSFNELVGSLKPDLVIINFGINDWRAGVPIDEYRSAMDGMVTEAAKLQCDCVLWTSGPVSSMTGESYGFRDPLQDADYLHRFDEYNDGIRNLAEQHQLILVDPERVFVEKWEKGLDLSPYFFDSFHFLQPGHDIILECMKSSLFSS